MSIFTRIINREIPAQIVYEDGLCLAFRDVAPQAPVHILMIPKEPIESIATLRPEDASTLGHIMVKIAEVAKAEGLTEAGYRVVSNVGTCGGQSVFHLHFHILGGRQMHWPPG